MITTLHSASLPYNSPRSGRGLLGHTHVLHPVVPRHLDALAAVRADAGADEREPLARRRGRAREHVRVPLAVLVPVLALVRVGVGDAAPDNGTEVSAQFIASEESCTPPPAKRALSLSLGCVRVDGLPSHRSGPAGEGAAQVSWRWRGEEARDGTSARVLEGGPSLKGQHPRAHGGKSAGGICGSGTE